VAAIATLSDEAGETVATVIATWRIDRKA